MRGLLAGGLASTSVHIGREQHARQRNSSLYNGASMCISPRSTSPPRSFRRGSTERMHERAKPPVQSRSPATPKAPSAEEGARTWRAGREQVAAMPTAGFSRSGATDQRRSTLSLG